MKPSSRDILTRHGWRIDRSIHNFVYFYFYGPYVKICFLATRLSSRLFSGMTTFRIVPRFVFDRYHSKILSREDVTKILTLEHDLDLGTDRRKRVLPFNFAKRIAFLNPKLIAVMDCPCVQTRTPDDPCQPLSKCIAVGEDFAPLWLEHCKEKYNARQITQEEALEIIRKLRSTGHVTQAFIKVATGGLTGVICNCCPKCCVELETTRLSRKIDPSVTQYVESGYSVNPDEALCTLCGRCQEICPFDAIRVLDGTLQYDRKMCMGCGLCVEQCPDQALSLYRDPEKLLPLDIELLQQELEEPSPH